MRLEVALRAKLHDYSEGYENGQKDYLERTKRFEFIDKEE